MADYKAMDIAKWFLAYNQDNPEFNDITPLKLQKLLYYAFGTYYALTDKKLFEEPIVAWQHGPVVKNVYQAYRHFKNKPISFDEVFSYDKFTQEDKEILESVYDRFGQYSAWKLRNMTHAEVPWVQTPDNCTIAPELIKEYFEQNYINTDSFSIISDALDGNGLSKPFDNVKDLMEALNA